MCAGRARELPPKVQLRIRGADVLVVETTGSGGYNPPTGDHVAIR